MPNKTPQAGFTLIEVLVALAIIAVAMSAAVRVAGVDDAEQRGFAGSFDCDDCGAESDGGIAVGRAIADGGQGDGM